MKQLFLEKKKQQKESVKKDLKPVLGEQDRKAGGIKKFRVRCLNCKNEFIVEVREGDKKVKCPVCGEEGEL